MVRFDMQKYSCLAVVFVWDFIRFCWLII